MTGMKEGELPFRYLGVPLDTQRLSILQCQPLVQRMLQKIQGWATRFLSYAGRVMLIKSVIQGIQNYWSQVFVLPQQVIKQIQSACRTFLWTGKADKSKRALVAWENIEKPYNAGGLNVINLKVWNRATISKQFWGLAQKKDRMWIKWLHAYYIKGQDIRGMLVPRQCSWMVRKIFGARGFLLNLPNERAIFEHHTFEIGKVYRCLRGNMERVPWAKVMCQTMVPPKVKMIGWLALHGRLSTCEYLRRINIEVDSICCLCQKEEETMDHLFFACDYAKEVWNGIMTTERSIRNCAGWERERCYLIQHCSNNNRGQRMYRCMVLVMIYYLWKEKNDRCIKGKRNDSVEIVRQCRFILAWCSLHDRKLSFV